MQHVNNILLYYVDYYPITLSPYDPITLLLYYSITLLLYYSITLLLYYSIILLLYYSITPLLYDSITLLLHYSMTLLFYESVKSIYCGDYCSMRNIYSNVYIILILWRLLLYGEYICILKYILCHEEHHYMKNI